MSCGGFCCERFRLRAEWSRDDSLSPEGLAQRAKEASPEDPHKFRQVAEMVIYLGYSTTNGNGDEDAKPSHWFTCKNFDTETRLCKIYETRPPLCRDHGTYRNHCGYSKCQLPQEPVAQPEVLEKKELRP